MFRMHELRAAEAQSLVRENSITRNSHIYIYKFICAPVCHIHSDGVVYTLHTSHVHLLFIQSNRTVSGAAIESTHVMRTVTAHVFAVSSMG